MSGAHATGAGQRNPELIATLKGKLRIEQLVGAAFGVKESSSREWEAVKHDSLKVNPSKQSWFWYSRSVGGDVLAFLAYQKFGRTEVDGADFVAVLKEACALAGIEFPEKRDAKQEASYLARRAAEGVLELYVRAAVKALRRDTEAGRIARVRARSLGSAAQQTRTDRTDRTDTQAAGQMQGAGAPYTGKAWLSDEIMDRWRLGLAPTLKQCLDEGLTEQQLHAVNLWKQSEHGNHESYPFFRDRLIVPMQEGGRVVYLGGRALSDYGHDGKKLESQKKFLYLAGSAHLKLPAAFNFETVYSGEARKRGVWLVEGCLDAIACEECLERPALAFLRSGPSEELCERLRKVA